MNILNYRNFINELVNNQDVLINKIDYTLLSQEATEEDIRNLCTNADRLGVKSVCVLPKMVSIAKECLLDSDVLVCTVVSFPDGANSIEEKINETNKVISDGADEVDMVMNYQYLLQNRDEYDTRILLEEVESLVDICHKNNKILKVIVESGNLNSDQTKIVTDICIEAGADFIKTSTGRKGIAGAELDKIKIMRDVISIRGSNMMIKASGGIRNIDDIQKFEKYVDRFGIGYLAVDNIFGNKEKIIGDLY